MSSANLGAAMAAPATNSLAVICVPSSVKQEDVVNLAAQPLSARAPPAENGGGGAAHQEAEEEKKHKKRSKNWTRLETLRLIRLRAELEPRFARTGRKSELWDEISESLRSENISRDAQQCRDKWEKLTAGYKEVRDGLRDRADNPFFEELDPLLSVKSAKKSDPRDREPAPPEANFNDGSNGANGVNGTDDEETAEEHEEEEEERPPAKRRRGGDDFVTEAGLGAMGELLESLVSRQQKFFVELLDSMERKEQIREQIRQEKEEKWRAEDRAQRCVFHNAMIVLTRKLLEADGLGFEPVPPPRHQHPHFGCGGGAAPPPGGGGGGGVKKRSKNWKRAEVLQLIKFRAEMEGRFAKSTRRAALWEELAELLGAEGIKRDGKQCREKWDKLMAEYKDVSDGKRDRSESPYFAELTSMIGRPAEAG